MSEILICFFMLSPAGLEPATSGLGILRSLMKPSKKYDQLADSNSKIFSKRMGKRSKKEIKITNNYFKPSTT